MIITNNNNNIKQDDGNANEQSKAITVKQSLITIHLLLYCLILQHTIYIEKCKLKIGKEVELC